MLLLPLATALVACGRSDDDRSVTLHALGTLVTLTFYDADETNSTRAVAELESLYASLGRDWYPWYEGPRPGELERINAAIARGDAVDVSPDLAALLKRAADIEQRSGGAFNVALGALTDLWGFNRPLQADWAPPTPQAVAGLMRDRPGSAHLHWQGNRLTSDSRTLVIDPGGIAKGAILGLSVAVLKRHGIDNAIVDLGGDMSVLGSVHGRAARIGLRDPDGGEPGGWVEARAGETIVTSGDYERFFEFRGRRYAHILDPHSGAPTSGTAAVTVLDADPVLADAAATALLVAGPGGFADTCRALGIRYALLTGAGGDLSLTPAMRERVHLTRQATAGAELRREDM